MSNSTRCSWRFAIALSLTVMLAREAVAPRVLADDDGHPPKVVLISLDGAKPELIEQYLKSGVLPRDKGLGELRRQGVVARQNITATPSLTAVSHIAIATGSTAVNNDIPSNTFHAVVTPLSLSLSGFAAPIGGYDLNPLGPSATPTAQPLWVRLRKAGKSVVTATWPGADGADIQLDVSTTSPPNNILVQGYNPTRLTDFAVPFGAFGGLGAKGFELTAANFGPDSTVTTELAAAGHTSFSPILATTTPFETFYCAPEISAECPDLDDEEVFLQGSSGSSGTCAAISVPCSDTTATDRPLKFEMRAALLDTTNDRVVNYDTVVFFEKTQGIQSGPFALPATGPAYVNAGGASAPFYFEGTGDKIGAAFFVPFIAPDLSQVRFTRYSANFIPRNVPILDDVDDINTNVGFWAPGPDYRIPERLSPGFASFPDRELEAIYEDQVKTFVRYQTQLAQRAINDNPGADLDMIYIEQPDGSGHQFTLTDPRQASDFTDPSSIGENQNPAKVARYAKYLEFAYQQANEAVAEIMKTVGPSANVFVVSDHGMAPFHTAVNMTNVLRNAGVDISKIAIRTSGPAVNIYVNLQDREAGGTVTPAEYQTLVPQIAAALQTVQDPNSTFNYSLTGGRIFTSIATRPLSCSEGIGFCTSDEIGQDSGDVVGIMAEGYNFDGVQPVARLGDPPYDSATSVFSVPNFYGSHGHDPTLPSMSASFLAAGPDLKHKTVSLVHNIDVAPTIMHLLGVEPAETVDGRVLSEILRK